MDLNEIKKSIPGTILKFAIPSIIAMVLTSLITIVDGFFIGNYVGEAGIAAINLGLPILYLFLAVGIMVGVGGSSISLRLIGGKKIDESNQVFNQTLITTLTLLALLSVIVFILFQGLLNLLRVESGLREYFNSYYKVMLITYPIMMFNTNMGMFIRGEGKPERFMGITVITVIINIVLDYILIKYAELGTQGAAVASLISVLLGTLLMVLYFLKSSNLFRFKGFTFSREVFRNTIQNGSSEFIGQLSMTVTMFAFNRVILREAGINGIAAFTIAGYIAYLFNMVIIGFGQGASPVISLSFGARDIKLSRGVRKTTNLFVFIIGLVFLGVLTLGSESYSSIFVKNSDVQKIVVSGISIFALAFLFSGVNVISSFYFTSIGNAKESALISASRGLVILLVLIVILPSIFGMQGVWLVAPVTEVLTLILTVILLYRHDRVLAKH